MLAARPRIFKRCRVWRQMTTNLIFWSFENSDCFSRKTFLIVISTQLEYPHLFATLVWFLLIFIPQQYVYVLKHSGCLLGHTVKSVWMNNENAQKRQDPREAQEKQKPNWIVVDATARHFGFAMKICSCTAYVQDTLITYLEAPALSRGNLLSSSFTVFLLVWKLPLEIGSHWPFLD